MLSPVEVKVPSLVHSMFEHNEDVNHHGHEKPLLSICVTELLDGVFIAVSANHSILDGTSFLHFWQVWFPTHTNGLADICRPVHNRWFPDGYGPIVTLPYTKPKQFITTYEETNVVEKIFRFSSDSMAKLRSKAREESGNSRISSLQALSALLWRSVVVAKGMADNDDQIFNCILVANDRHRLIPKLPMQYFGNCIGFVENKLKVGDLLAQSLGWAASLLQQSVASHDDKFIRESVATWMESRGVYQPAELFNSSSLMITHSPRFDVYGNEFVLGKPVAIRSGYAYKFGGVVSAYPGPQGGGSIDLDICLPSHVMTALQSDAQFMSFVET